MLGPLPIHWAARLENVTPSGFDDRLLRGPFAHWRHRHRFEALAPGRTKVIDEITFTLRLHPLWLPVGLVMTASLPLLFRYRAAQTSRLLQAELLEPANPA
jgi:hypothetical protein